MEDIEIITETPVNPRVKYSKYPWTVESTTALLELYGNLIQYLLKTSI
jgi:hypothetical protein